MPRKYLDVWMAQKLGSLTTKKLEFFFLYHLYPHETHEKPNKKKMYTTEFLLTGVFCDDDQQIFLQLHQTVVTDV